ncbi:MAG: DUF4270 family protein [Mangrovibacterium sp.]
MNNNWFLAFVLLMFASCNIDGSDFDMGEDLINSHSKVFLTDTFSVRLSTVQIDSLLASSLDEVVMGKYEHPSLGTMDIEHYFKVQYKTVSEDATFDSLTVKLRYSDYSLGDTLETVEFSIYQLSKELDIYDEPNVSTDYNYNTTRYPYDEANIVGTYRFTPYPHKDSIEFKLNDDFGQAVFDWIQSDEDNENSSTSFLKYQKGFVIKQTAGKPIILGLSNSNDDDIQLRFYTHKQGSLEEEDIEYELDKVTTKMNYSGVDYDRTGTLFADLVSQKEEIPSSKVDGLAVIQGSSGLMVKVDFPSIEQINGLNNTSLVRTDLFLVPDMDICNPDELPETLYLYYTNKRNEFLPSTMLTTSSNEYVTASLSKDKLEGEYYYAVNITSYMASQMADNDYDTDNGLVIALDAADMYSSADVVFLSNIKKSGKMKTKLNLYFLQNND